MLCFIIEYFSASFISNFQRIVKVLLLLFFSDNGSRCPVYPTELVIALDMSAGVTPQAFEQMRSAALSLLEDVSIAKTNCPWGARVSVITYSSESRNLIRFTDHLEKKTLLEAVKTFALERTTKTRDIGQAMSFVARNIFKRVRKGRLMRKVAVFFTNGPSRDESSLATAMLEFKAADIGLGVIALNPADDVNRAMQVDNMKRIRFAHAKNARHLHLDLFILLLSNKLENCSVNVVLQIAISAVKWHETDNSAII